MNLTYEISKFDGKRFKTSEHIYCETTQLSFGLVVVAIRVSDLVQSYSKNKLSAILSFQTLNIFETWKNCPVNFPQYN
jgi:hypothetical protein